jgi:hypothetical protein
MISGLRFLALRLSVAILSWTLVTATQPDRATLCGATARSPQQLVRQLEPLGEPARAGLLALAQSPDLTEALCGISGLSALGDARVIPHLAAALKNPAWRDHAYDVARSAALLAGAAEPGIGAAMGPVIDALEAPAVWAATGTDGIWLLGEIDHPRARERLLAVLDETRDDAAIDAAVHGLARQGEGRARERIAGLGDEAARAKSGNATPEQARRLGEVAFYQLALGPDSVEAGLATLGTIALRDQREAAAWAVHTLCAREVRTPLQRNQVEAHRHAVVQALDARGIDWRAPRGAIACPADAH